MKPMKIFGGPRAAIDDLPGSGEMLELNADGASETESLSPAVLSAERAIIGAILASNGIYDDLVEVLRADDFADAGTKAAFAAISEIVEGEVPGVTVADAISVSTQHTLGQLVPYQTLVEWSAAANLDAALSYAGVVAAAAAERALRSAAQQAQAIVSDGRSLGERTADLSKVIERASESRTLPVKNIGAAAVEAIAEMVERAKSGESFMGITTGIEDLDALTAGLHGGQVIVIGARPGIGKTALAMSIGLAAAKAGTPTVMASLEMKAKQLAKRALAMESGVNSHNIRVGALTEACWEAIATASEMLIEMPFDIVDSAAIDLVGLRNSVRRMHRQGKCGLLIIDYLQLMSVSDKESKLSRNDQVATISRGLKKLALELDIPIIVLSQLNRKVDGRLDPRPIMSDLRESGAVEQDADTIIFIHRDGSADECADGEDVVELIVAKQRDGAVGVVRAGYRRSSTRYFGLPSSNSETYMLAAA